MGLLAERMQRLAERHKALAQTFQMHNAILLRLEATEVWCCGKVIMIMSP